MHPRAHGVPIEWGPMPPEWYKGTAHIRLWLSKGTMMPRQPRQKLKRKRESQSSFSSDATTPSAPSTPVLARRVLTQPQPQPSLPDELLLGDAATQEVEAAFVRQYRAMHDAMRSLIEARLARAEPPLVDKQREALAEQLRLSSASELLFGWHDRDQEQDRSREGREALSDREGEVS